MWRVDDGCLAHASQSSPQRECTAATVIMVDSVTAGAHPSRMYEQSTCDIRSYGISDVYASLV